MIQLIAIGVILFMFVSLCKPKQKRQMMYNPKPKIEIEMKELNYKKTDFDEIDNIKLDICNNDYRILINEENLFDENKFKNIFNNDIIADSDLINTPSDDNDDDEYDIIRNDHSQ